MKRERLGSRLGFIFLSAGCAIGIGNVWKFPYMAGQNGGGLFVVIYLFFLIVMGVPIMTMEFAMGRASRRSPAKMYQELEPQGSKWHIHGIIAVMGNYILMMFYTTVAGWMLYYFVSTAGGNLTGMDTAGVAGYFRDMLSDGKTMVIYMAVIVLIGFLICSLGLQKGLEKITKVMMTVLIVIMIALAVHSFFIKGGEEGLAFYLLPNVESIRKIGVANVIVAAMNQAFFTLSLGIGAMAIFGSYIGNEHALLGEAFHVALLDTFVAMASGLIIFPACFAYGVQPDSGPSLIFMTLPNIFNHIAGGRIWGSLFFIFMTFAAFSTVLAVFEGILSSTMDFFGWSRTKACAVNAVLLFVLSLPCALGFNILSGIKPFGGGSTIMDLEDFAVSNIVLPLGSLIFILFCVSKKGWGWENFVTEANKGKGLKVRKIMKGYMTYVLPAMVLVVFLIGLVQFIRGLL